MQEVVQGHRPRRAAGRDRADLGEAAPARSWSPAPSTSTAGVRPARSWPINCAAIPETLLESELFGHEKGAFTGADRRRIGKFEQCNGGTLVPRRGRRHVAADAEQDAARACRSSASSGSAATRRFRPTCASSRPPTPTWRRLVAAGRFRQDLYYRLNVFTIRLPPLRERGDDLPLLVDHYRPALQPRAGQGRARGGAGDAGGAAAALLAGQRARAAERADDGSASCGRAGPAAGVPADVADVRSGQHPGRRPGLRPGAIHRRPAGRRARKACTPRRCGGWSGTLLPRVLRHTNGNQLRRRPRSSASRAAACGPSCANWACASTTMSPTPKQARRTPAEKTECGAWSRIDHTDHRATTRQRVGDSPLPAFVTIYPHHLMFCVLFAAAPAAGAAACYVDASNPTTARSPSHECRPYSYSR